MQEEQQALEEKVADLERQLAESKAKIAFGPPADGDFGEKQRFVVQELKQEQQRVVSGAQSLLSAALVRWKIMSNTLSIKTKLLTWSSTI